MMSKTFSRVLWVLAGVLLILAGVLCMSRPAVALEAISLYLGVPMLVSGVVDLIVYARGRNYMFGSGWLLVEGILTVILSLFLLFNQAFTALTLPFVFGMWLLFTGVSQVVGSLDLHHLGVRGWGWFTAIGVIMALAGFFSFLNPVGGMVTLGALTGILLLLEGVAAILRAVLFGRDFP